MNNPPPGVTPPGAPLGGQQQHPEDPRIRFLRLPRNMSPTQFLEQAFKPLRVDESLIKNPNPITLYLGLWGRTAYVTKTVRRSYALLEMIRLKTGRDPTQPEMDAVLELTSQGACRSSLGLPGGALAGFLWQAYRLRYSMDWEMFFAPQVPPGGRMTAARFMKGWELMGDAGTLGGGRPMLWARLFKVVVAAVTGDFVVGVWASWKEASAWRDDERLRRYTEEVRNMADSAAGIRSRQIREKVLQRQMELEQMRRREQAGETGEGDGGAEFASEYQHQDDASPVAGEERQFARYEQHYPHAGAGGAGGGNDEHTAMPTTRQSPAWWSRSAGSSARQSESADGGDFFGDDDDASPVAPDYRGSSSSRATGGSAWDRIRNNAAQGAQSNSHAAEWSRAERESGRYSERERAQADFDRMVDAERHAGSDSGRGSGGWSKW
ncbi:putative endo-1,3(4)-beta-glucanase [Aspergillus saccharolyticus JOP 1030-1]|uniref:Endo-1,3(4)-beta-glucanase n=1 Tax=Aspergillus saccharolyticus JOP 1030-1 TaxID=1450539 RepID=A0A318ZZ55_9EURO|nr:hypothetical protein BP01DRAFT_387736 [Aspergillus saccharolyticus JOP 1030-1]PYH49563.1 hypothetical protein BP01DRAFT_387736 [Aspergillus saccharolyticus JOP 1030-1]